MEGVYIPEWIPLLRFYCDKVDVNSPCQAKVSILLQALLSYVIKVSRIFEHFPRTVLLSRAATGPDALAVRSVHSLLLLLRGVLLLGIPLSERGPGKGDEEQGARGDELKDE